MQLVLKVNNPHADPAALERFAAALEPVKRHAVVIDRTLTENEVKSLVRTGDAFLSLHRAEGFGFGLGEAMYFGKPVIATAYSGNMDFMTPVTSCLVGHALVPVREREYPHATGQVWAEPDVGEAVRWMIPAGGRAGARARDRPAGLGSRADALQPARFRAPLYRARGRDRASGARLRLARTRAGG